MASRKTDDVADDEAFALPQTVVCCDCGAAHRVDALVKGGKVWVAFRRAARAAALTRRQHVYEFIKRKSG